jgi:hypothetical protein
MWFARLYGTQEAVEKELIFELTIMTRALEQLTTESYLPRRAWLENALVLHAVTCMRLKAKSKSKNTEQELLLHTVCQELSQLAGAFKLPE